MIKSILNNLVIILDLRNPNIISADGVTNVEKKYLDFL